MSEAGNNSIVERVRVHCKYCYADLGEYSMEELYDKGFFIKDKGVDISKFYCSDECRLYDRFKK